MDTVCYHENVYGRCLCIEVNTLTILHTCKYYLLVNIVLVMLSMKTLKLILFVDIVHIMLLVNAVFIR